MVMLQRLDTVMPTPQNSWASSPTAERVWQVLQDIVHYVELDKHFTIRHPEYPDFELPAEIVTRFEKLPREIQDRYRRLQLRSFLYGVYYNGSIKPKELATESTEKPQDLENNIVLGVDVGFYQRLHENNQGKGYFDSGWSVVGATKANGLVVSKAGLRLHVECDLHLQPMEQNTEVGTQVSILLPKNRVQNGFYMAVGDAGMYHAAALEQSSTTIRIYFNITPEGAITLMKLLTYAFNEFAIPFSFKVLYNPEEYTRYDAGVLYFDRRDYDRVQQLLSKIYSELRRYFGSQVPLFTKTLALGLGLAEEPNQKFMSQESFGMNRCQMIADGLLAAWQQNQQSPECRMQTILQQFSQKGIDWQYAYLNAQSEDIYTPLLTFCQE